MTVKYLTATAFILGIFLFGLCFCNSTFCVAQDSALDDGKRIFQVDMRDKTRVIGEPDLIALKMNLGFAEIAIPIELIRSVEVNKKPPVAGPGKYIVVLRNGDRVSGDVLNPSIKVSFLAGEVTLPFDQIESFKWLPTGKAIVIQEAAGAVFQFDFESSTKTTVKNTVANRHHGRRLEVNIREDRVMKSRKNVAELKGDGSLKIDHHADLCPQKFTLSAWVKPTGNRGSYAIIAGKTTPSSWNDGYAFAYMQNDPTNVYFFVNGYTATTIKTPLPNDKWSHLVGTCDGKNVVLYLNGRAVGRSPFPKGTPVRHSNSAFMIGADVNSYHWKGRIDNVALSNGAHSAAVVKQKYESEK